MGDDFTFRIVNEHHQQSVCGVLLFHPYSNINNFLTFQIFEILKDSPQLLQSSSFTLQKGISLFMPYYSIGVQTKNDSLSLF